MSYFKTIFERFKHPMISIATGKGQASTGGAKFLVLGLLLGVLATVYLGLLYIYATQPAYEPPITIERVEYIYLPVDELEWFGEGYEAPAGSEWALPSSL